MTGLTAFAGTAISDLSANRFRGLTPSRVGSLVSYDNTNDTYELLFARQSFDEILAFGAADRDPSRDDQVYSAYTATHAGLEYEIGVFNRDVRGESLSFASFAKIADPAGSATPDSFEYVTFGLANEVEDRPVSGTAQFYGNIYGTALILSANKNLVGQETIDFEGDFDMRVNFDDLSVLAYLSPYIPGLGFDLTDYAFAGSFGGTRDFKLDPVESFVNANFQGHFFGPNAEEVAGTFNIDDRFDYLEYYGVALGSQTVSRGPNASVAQLEVSEAFRTVSTGTTYGADASGHVVAGISTSGPAPDLLFTYDAQNDTYMIRADSSFYGNGALLFDDSRTIEVASGDDRFLLFEGLSPGINEVQLFVYVPGPQNPQLELTYSGFGMFNFFYRNRDRNLSAAWFAYGQSTRPVDVPINGSATYSGVLWGKAINTDVGREFGLEGSTFFDVNFATNELDADFTIMAVAADGTVLDAGQFATTGVISRYFDHAGISGSLDNPGVGPGQFEGIFYGPDAEELGGTFSTNLQFGSDALNYRAFGAFGSVQD